MTFRAIDQRTGGEQHVKSSPPWLQVTPHGIKLRVRVVPGSSQSSIADTTTTELRIRIAAPPVDGKANQELQKFLAKIFRVRRSAVTIVNGASARVKSIEIAGDAASLTARAHTL